VLPQAGHAAGFKRRYDKQIARRYLLWERGRDREAALSSSSLFGPLARLVCNDVASHVLAGFHKLPTALSSQKEDP
jgi:hypothetical protein